MKMKKKIQTYIKKAVPFLLCVFLWSASIFSGMQIDDAETAENKDNAVEANHINIEEKELYARGAVLMDGVSGRILFGKNEEEKLPNASTTKIMTCILALELSDINEEMQVSAYAASQPRVHLGMNKGQSFLEKSPLW